MKISVDDKELFTITDVQKNVIKDYISSEVFEDDIRRRLFWIINELHNEAFKKLKAKWEPILVSEGAESIPAKQEAFAELIFARPDYKDRSARDLEAAAVDNP